MDDVLRRGGGGDLESMESRRPLRGGVTEGETRLVFRRGGVIDLDMDLDSDLDKFRPRCTPFPFPFPAGGGVND